MNTPDEIQIAVMAYMHLVRPTTIHLTSMLQCLEQKYEIDDIFVALIGLARQDQIRCYFAHAGTHGYYYLCLRDAEGTSTSTGSTFNLRLARQRWATIRDSTGTDSL